MQFLKKDQMKRLLVNYQQNGYKIAYPRQRPSPHSLEKKAQKAIEKQHHKQMIEKYWAEQTIKENKYIEEFNQQQAELKQRKLQRWRNNIAIQSQHAVEHIAQQTQKNEEKQKKYLEWKLKEEHKGLNRQRMLQMLGLDSGYWFNLDNLETKMKEEMLIPNTIYDNTDYYVRLLEQSMLLESAQYSQLDQGINNTSSLKFKNKRLIPLFSEIKSLIKHLNSDWQWKYQRELQLQLNKLEDKVGNNQDLLQKQKQQLEQAYQKIIRKEREERESPNRQLQEMEEQLVILYNLLVQWQRYIQLVKMDNKRVEVMKSLEEEVHSQYHTAQSVQNKQEDYSWQLDTSKVDIQDEGELSANEKITSDEEDVDVADVISNANFKQKQVDHKIDLYSKLTKNQKDQIFNEYKTKEKTDYKIEQLFSLWEEKAEQEQKEKEGKQEEKKNEIEDDDLTSQQELQQMLYGYIPEEFKFNQKNLSQMSVKALEESFPQHIVEEMSEFNKAYLVFPTIDNILAHEQQQDNNYNIKANRLQTTVLVEVIKARLTHLGGKANNNYKINQLYQVLNIIAEIHLDEAPLLFKLLNVYHPATYNS